MIQNKRGQFYLIAVIVIIAVFLGVLAMQNSLRKSSSSDIEPLKKELDIEKNKLLDYMAYNDIDSSNADVVFTDFSNGYLNRMTLNKDILFIFGTQSNIKVLGHNFNSEILQFNTGNGQFQDIEDIGMFSISFVPTSDLISFKLDDTEKSFELNEGQNIYYWIRYSNNDEEHFISG